MQFFTLGLKIPSGERSVEIKTQLTCDSLGVVITEDMVKDYDLEKRHELYANLISSLAHLYHSAGVMNNTLVEQLQSILDTIKEAGAPLFPDNEGLSNEWEAYYASSDDKLGIDFFINEVDEHGVPKDADLPDGYLVARYSIDDFDMVPVAVELKKYMHLNERAKSYGQLFDLLREHSPEKEERDAWFKQLERIFQNDEHRIVKNTYWSRHFKSGEHSVEVTFRPLHDLADLCEFEGVCGLNIMSNDEKSFLRVEELPDA